LGHFVLVVLVVLRAPFTLEGVSEGILPMRTDHRRPLVAYVLVTLACAFVVAPSLDLGGLGLGTKPTFSAFSDTTMTTPSEVAEQVIDPTRFQPVPDSELVDEPVTEGKDTFVPNVDVITDAVEELPWVMGDGETADVAGSDSDVGGSQGVSDPPQASLVDSGGSSSDGNGPSGDGNGSSGNGDGATGGPTERRRVRHQPERRQRSHRCFRQRRRACRPQPGERQ